MNPSLEIVLATLLWGFGAALIKWANLPSESLTFIRMVVPTIVVGGILLFQGKKLFVHHKGIYIASALNAARIFLLFWGISLTSIGNAWIILYTWPFFAVLYSPFFTSDQLNKRDLVLLCSSFLGIVIMFSTKEFSFANKDFLGMILVLLSAMLYPLSVLMLKRDAHEFTTWEMVFYMNILGAVLFLPFFVFNPLPTSTQIGIALLFGVTSGIIGFVLFYSALKRIPATLASALTYLEVVSALACGVIFFHETITITMIIGGLLVLGSTYLLQRKPSVVD